MFECIIQEMIKATGKEPIIKSSTQLFTNNISFFDFAQCSISELITLPNIGPAKIKALKQANFNTIWQLLTYKPKKIIMIDNACLPLDKTEKYITVKVKLLTCIKKSASQSVGKKINFIITFQDLAGQQGKIFIFTKALPFSFQANKELILSGKCSNNIFIHPKIFTPDISLIHQYFLPAPLFDNTFQHIIKECLLSKACKEIAYHTHTKPADNTISATPHEYSWETIFTDLHFGTPEKSQHALDILKKLEAISYRNILQKQHKQMHIEPIYGISKLYEKIYSDLRKTLTTCQTEAIKAIEADFQKNIPSQRMIFGDVGTGKTRIMILAALHALSNNKKVLFLAPTKLLADQVFKVFSHTLQTLKENDSTQLAINIALLSQNSNLTKNLKNNSSQNIFSEIIIGTHALFQEKYSFEDVGLIIIDEQHKFGVKQRNALIQKAPYAHHISLSATPIPRTLMMVMQHYLKVSILKHKPKPVQINTYLLKKDNLDTFMQQLKANIKPNELVYWICPAISDEEDELTYINAEERFAILQQIFFDKVGLIHGKVKKDDQDLIYQQALKHEIQILVSTTVVEVGIDIPHANIIIIEDANRFGLAQLHQLRGRVGRNGQPGKCILIYPEKIGPNGKQRLEAMKNITDGFTLAEKDLEIRGFGTILGTAQTGFYDFHFLQLPFDTDILNTTQNHPYDQNTLNSLSRLFFYEEALMSM